MVKEIKKMVQTYKYYISCPKCGEGVMCCDYINQFMSSLLMQKGFEHTCNKCGYKETYMEAYPREETEEVEV